MRHVADGLIDERSRDDACYDNVKYIGTVTDEIWLQNFGPLIGMGDNKTEKK